MLTKKILLFLVWLASFTVQAQPDSIDAQIDRALICRDIPTFTRRLIIAQARLESGNYSSNLFKQHNNVFANLHPRRRNTLSIGPLGKAEGRHGYASFKTIEDSVDDLLLYFYHVGLPTYYKSAWQYVRGLKKRHYFGSSEQQYLRAIKYYSQPSKSK